jgi:F0F1-type ATP synthase membrane subunit c/vacuolar-type H+-ATPase subunit K
VLPDDDPGWPSLRSSLIFLLPGGIQYGMRRRRDEGIDGLLVIRQVFLSFVGALIGFGIVVAVLYQSSTPLKDPPVAFAAGLSVLGIVGVAIEPRIGGPLNCTSDAALAGSFRTRFFLRMAFANAAALFGFVGFFLTYAWWPYPVGLGIAAFAFSRTAPTRGNLRREQERLVSTSCYRSLVRALRGTGAGEANA